MGGWGKASQFTGIVGTEEIRFDFKDNHWNEIEKKMHFFDTNISTSQICGFEKKTKFKNKVTNTFAYSKENNI